jgi:hypothetical protein
MAYNNAWHIIDEEISSFNGDKQFHISTDTHSNWLVFETRRIMWYRDGVKYFIQLYPEFNDREIIICWNLYACAWFDKKTDRYSKSKVFASKMQLHEIAMNIKVLLNEAYCYINEFKKRDIPKETSLSSS